MPHQLPPLPYDLNALEPHISAETLEYHHGKHHRKYVETLNQLIDGTEFQDQPLETIITQAGDGPVFNNAGQAWNHAFYWQCLSPDGGGRPQGRVADALEATFDSFEGFKKVFETTASELFGSGWLWLVKTTADTVAIQPTKDADTPLRYGRTVLLTCDLWEHAYYIDHRNDRSAYMAAFWEVVNWPFVEQRMQAGGS